MHVLLLLIGLLLGTAAPASIGAITTLQWVELSLTLASDARKLPKLNAQMRQIVESPAFRAWVAANGEKAIQLQPGEITER